jgi:glucose-6-phosphate dehydrogenase assembly protein OpcA
MEDVVTSELLSRIATVVIVGEPDRITDGAAALDEAPDRAAMRAILISTGRNPAPVVRQEQHAIVLEGLQPQFLNNALAALRLSSLPTLVWWRGGDPQRLEGLATLADRVVLDAEDPEPAWAAALSLFERSAFSDLRWTRLTRWRALMANFFDIPAVRFSTFARLEIAGSDRHSARLFAGWMQASLGWGGGVALEYRESAGPGIQSIRLSGATQDLRLRLAASGTCVEAAAEGRQAPESTRTIPLGGQSLAALIDEELRVRARDYAFERALRHAVERTTDNG